MRFLEAQKNDKFLHAQSKKFLDLAIQTFGAHIKILCNFLHRKLWIDTMRLDILSVLKVFVFGCQQ